MQNTQRLQNHPKTLIDNFFAAGLSQDTLAEKFNADLQDQVKIEPEVLFSMFQPKKKCQDYLFYIFPEYINLVKEKHAVFPKFFSFMSTDANGFTAYFHVLQFYEEFDKDIINKGFNRAFRYGTQELIKLIKSKSKKRTTSRISKISFANQLESNQKRDSTQTSTQKGLNSSTEVSSSGNVSSSDPQDTVNGYDEDEEDDDNDWDAMVEKKDVVQKSKQLDQKCKIFCSSTVANHQRQGFKKQHTKVSELASKSHAHTQGNDNMQAMTNQLKSIPTQIHVTQVDARLSSIHEEEQDEDDDANIFDLQVNRSMRNVSNFSGHRQAAYSKAGGFNEFQKLEAEARQKAAEEGSFGPLFEQDESKSSLNVTLTTDRESKPDLQVKGYAPIAFVIKTQVENHDIFRSILLELFERIRDPQKITKNSMKNQKLAFAEFIAHLAFLRTIPCPSFNTIYNIKFFNLPLQIVEGPFNEIPNKNRRAIEILFDILDVNTILYCWKALLFDKTLVLISCQKSLQFYVAEGLKQLLFPLTWTNSYVQPANRSLIDYVESPSPLIFCIGSLEADYDEFVQMTEFDEDLKDKLAILDIDGCFKNDIKFPSLSRETLKVRTLNQIINRKVLKYDTAYKEIMNKQIEKETKAYDFVKDVRQIFYGYLKEYLADIWDYIDTVNCKAEDSSTVFAKYFKKDLYMEQFGSENDPEYKFAAELIQSPAFQQFCDQAFSDDLTNYKMFLAIEGYIADPELRKEQAKRVQLEMIAKKKAEQQRRSKENIQTQLDKKGSKDTTTTTADSSTNDQTNNEMSFSGRTQELEDQKEWPRKEPVVINWRMPQDYQRVTLFEKLFYLNQDMCSKIKEMKDQHSQAGQELMKNLEEYKFEPLYNEIRDLYYQDALKQNVVRPSSLGKIDKSALKKTATTIGAKNKTKTFIEDLSDIESSSSSDGNQGEDNAKLANENHLPHCNLYQDPNEEHDEEEFSLLRLNSNAVCNCYVTTTRNKKDKNKHLTFDVESFEHEESTPQIAKLAVMSKAKSSAKSRETSQVTQVTFQEEEDEDSDNALKIVKLVYGKDGLITFLEHLFGLLDESAIKQVNFFFALKRQFEHMSGSSELIHADQGQKITPYVSTPLAYDLGVKLAHGSQFKKARTKEAIDTNRLENYEEDKDGFSVCTEDVWFIPNQWWKRANAIRNTQQFIMLKVKLFWSFESFEDSISQSFLELMRFPKADQETFPLTKFNGMLANLTLCQKEQYLEQNRDLIQKTNIFQFAHIKKYIQKDKAAKALPEVELRQMKNIKDYLDEQQRKKEESEQKLSRTQNNYNNQALGKDRRQNNLLSTDKPKKKDKGFFKFGSSTKEEKRLSAMPKTLSNSQRQDLGGGKLDCSDNPFDSTATINQGRSLEVNSALGMSGRTTVDMYALANTGLLGSTDTMNWEQVMKQSQSSANSVKIQHSESIITSFQSPKNAKSFRTLTCPEAIQKSVKLLDKILALYKEYQKFMTKNGSYEKSYISKMQQSLLKVFESAEKFRMFKLDFTGAYDNKDDEDGKQCFWLNILNFLTLYKLMEIALLNPKWLENINKQTNYNIWQVFFQNSEICITGIKINSFDIWNSVLRQELDQANISIFMQPKKALCEFDPQFQDYIVREPNQFISFGRFLPIEGTPKLQVFDKESMLATQLKEAAKSICIKDTKVCSSHYLVRIPKYMVWHRKDFGGDDLGVIMEFILKNQLFACCTKDQRNTEDLIKVLKATQKPMHMVDPVKITWKINYQFLKQVQPRKSREYMVKAPTVELLGDPKSLEMKISVSEKIQSSMKKEKSSPAVFEKVPIQKDGPPPSQLATSMKKMDQAEIEKQSTQASFMKQIAEAKAKKQKAWEQQQQEQQK